MKLYMLIQLKGSTGSMRAIIEKKFHYFFFQHTRPADAVYGFGDADGSTILILLYRKFFLTSLRLFLKFSALSPAMEFI